MRSTSTGMTRREFVAASATAAFVAALSETRMQSMSAPELAIEGIDLGSNETLSLSGSDWWIRAVAPDEPEVPGRDEGVELRTNGSPP